MKHRLLSCIESKLENNKTFYGKFKLGPLDLGQGLTVANGLRRTLLSEISGLAIILVEIEGANHEYSTLPGMSESVLDILLNLKKLVLSSNLKITQPQIGFIYVQGPIVVRAKDLKLPSFIRCLDPEQYIATLSYNGILNLKFAICTGKNYINQTPITYTDLCPFFESRSFKPENFIFKDKKKNKVFNTNIQYINNIFWNKKYKPISAFILYPEIQPILTLLSKSYQKFQIFQQWEFLKQQILISNSFISNLTTVKLNTLNYSNFLSFKATLQEFEDSNFLINFALDNPILKFFFNNQKFIFKSKLGSIFKNTKIQEKVFLNSKAATTKNFRKNFFSYSKKKNLSSPLVIDAFFTPINKVNYFIESKNFKKQLQEYIVLEIWTNASIHPRQAIHDASKQIISLFYSFQETKIINSLRSEKISINTTFSQKLYKKEKLEGTLYDNGGLVNEKKNLVNLKNKKFNLERKFCFLDIANLNLSLNVFTSLKRANINTIGDLFKYSREDLILLKIVEKNSLEEIDEILNLIGLNLKNK